jgi:hypothetical protein
MVFVDRHEVLYIFNTGTAVTLVVCAQMPQVLAMSFLVLRRERNLASSGSVVEYPSADN